MTFTTELTNTEIAALRRNAAKLVRDMTDAALDEALGRARTRGQDAEQVLVRSFLLCDEIATEKRARLQFRGDLEGKPIGRAADPACDEERVLLALAQREESRRGG